jgi:hypothetical protein
MHLGFREESTMVVSLVYKQHRGYDLLSFKPLEGKTLRVPCLSLNDDEGNNVPEIFHQTVGMEIIRWSTSNFGIGRQVNMNM